MNISGKKIIGIIVDEYEHYPVNIFTVAALEAEKRAKVNEKEAEFFRRLAGSLRKAATL